MSQRARDSSSSSACSSEGVEERRERKRERREKRGKDRDEEVVEEDQRRRTVSRSRSRSPIRYSSRRVSTSRSRSRSRSSTPARYERQTSRRRVVDAHETRHYHTHRSSAHHDSYDRTPMSANYDTGARRAGFIRSRNMIEDGRDNPQPSPCLGIFGMPPWIREYDLRNMFEPYGTVDQMNVVINRHTGQCRGYGFVYFRTVEEAKRARSAMRDAKIDGIPIRVDFSVTDQRRRRD